MRLGEYYDELERHDWFYEYSDDHSVWRRGQAARKKLASIAHQSPEHKALWEGFNKHVFSGEPWGTEKAPKPERPGGRKMAQNTDTERLYAIGYLGLTVVCDQTFEGGVWKEQWRCYVPLMGPDFVILGSSIRQVIDDAIECHKVNNN